MGEKISPDIFKRFILLISLINKMMRYVGTTFNYVNLNIYYYSNYLSGIYLSVFDSEYLL